MATIKNEISGYSLVEIYNNAIDELRSRKSSGYLAESDYELITNCSSIDDVLKELQNIIQRFEDTHANRKIWKIADAVVTRLERFGSAIDLLAQSMPEAGGMSPVGIIWGLVRFLLVVGRDVAYVLKEVLDVLEQLELSLPRVELYVGLFATSDIRVLKTPLTHLYAEIVHFGLLATKHFTQSMTKIIWSSLWSSSHDDFQACIIRISRATGMVDRAAEAEHMYQTREDAKSQRRENKEAEMFRHDARLFFSQARNISASLSDSTESYPRINDIPQCLLSDRFTGRSEELDIIARTHQTPHSDRPIIFVIYGMSGLGKTQLALKYADVAFRKKEYSFVFWLQASSTAKLHQGFINILNLINHPDRYHSDENVRLTMTRLWLESHSRNPSLRWLLVIDNASTSSIPFLRENLPRNNALGSILLTTQSDVVAKALPASSDHTLQLTIPTTQEAATMFIQEVQRALPQMPLSQSETEDLVMCVGRLPLAVTHAASFMAASQMTLSDILGMYRSDQKLQLLTWDNKLSTYEEKSVATAFKRKFEFLDQHSLHAGNLLRLMSFFDPERIPTDVIIDGLKALKASTCLTKKVETDLPLTTNKRNFRNRVMRYISFQRHGSNGSIKPEEMAKFTRTTAVDRMVDSISETILSPIRLQEALAELQDQSLITRIQSSATLEVQMHDLVKFMVQEMDMILESRTTMLNFASCIVCNAFRLVPDRTSPEAWPKCERIVPHIVSLKNMTHSGTVPELKWATAELAEYFRSRGLYSEAESYYKEALDQSLSASSHPEFLCGLADALVKQGQYDEAEKVCTQGLHGNDLANGNISGHSVTIAAQLVNVYDKQGRYAEAIKLGEWILPKPGRTVDPALSDTLQTMHNMGLAYGHQAQYDKAEEFLTQVLSSNERREGYGPNHPETLRSVNALANLYDRKGQHEEAAKLYMRAIEGREKLFGADHSQTLKSVCGLANLWMRKGLLGEAKELYLRALETSKTHQSCDNPDLLRAVHGLAAVLSFQGNYDESVIQYERVVAGRMAILGAEHADTLRSMEGLAIVYLFTRKLPKARELFEKVLTGRRKCLGENHPETLKTKEDLSYFQQMD